MKFQFALKVLLAVTTIAGLYLPASAAVVVNEGNGVNITMENDALKLNIAVEGGARISQLINKKTGHDLVALWKGVTDDGGLLDDRNVFTSFAYRATVTQPGGKVGQVRLTAVHPDGLSMVKTLTLRDDASTLEVSETLSNGGQQPARFMLRSFLLPGGGPLTEADQYFLPVKDKTLQPTDKPNGWFDNLAAPWSALWNNSNGEGVLVAAPGVEKFYFWQGSTVNPTYEWAYPDVAAGKSLTVNYALHIINNTNPNWVELSAATLNGLSQASMTDVPGWQNEEQRFKVTAAEQTRGFWLSTGNGSDKRRVPEQLNIDAPLNQQRSVYIALNALKDFAGGDLTVAFKNIPPGLVQAAWQVSGKGYVKVVPFDTSQKVDLKNGAEGRLWLTINGGYKAQDANGQIEISLNGQKTALPLEAKVWPVQAPQTRPFDVRGYGNFATLTGGYAVTPQTIKQGNAMLDYFQAIGGDTLDWTVSWPNVYRYLKVAGSNQPLADWLKKNRAAFQQKPVGEWPGVDFSYYNPWMEAAAAHGLTRVTTYLNFRTAKSLPAVEEEWILSQLKAYLETQGIHKFICKISDEISPDEIPAYIEQAQLARRAGWQTTTTVTGLITRTAADINQLNPYLNTWVLNVMTTKSFDDLLHQSYRLQEETVALPSAKWGAYKNGGARNTVAQQFFGTLVSGTSAEVENFQVFQDSQPLVHSGSSPWGNQKQGVFFTNTNNYLYISPVAGTDIKQARITVKYQARVPVTDGPSLAKIDVGDQVWFYGGLSASYKDSYENAATYPLKALQGKYAGYAYYAFYRPDEDKILWYDAATGQVSTGPAYLGLKDGWNDACLMAWLAQSKQVPVSQFISAKPDAPLRVGDVERESYRWENVVNLTDPFVLNTAREKMLAAAVKP